MSVFRFGLLLAVAGACFLLTVTQQPQAAGFDARPVTIETHGGNVASITITNPGDRKIYLQNSVQEWHQDASGHDVLTESAAAIISPPGMWIPPGATYNLRVQLPHKSEIQAGRIVFAVTQSLPAFSEPTQLTPAVLRAHLVDLQHLLITNN